jgi:hypothetical protein
MGPGFWFSGIWQSGGVEDLLARGSAKESWGVNAQKLGAVRAQAICGSRCFTCGCIFQAVQATAELLALSDGCCAEGMLALLDMPYLAHDTGFCV